MQLNILKFIANEKFLKQEVNQKTALYNYTSSLGLNFMLGFSLYMPFIHYVLKKPVVKTKGIWLLKKKKTSEH